MEKVKIRRTSIIITPSLEDKIFYIKSKKGTTTTSEVFYQAIHETWTKLKEME